MDHHAHTYGHILLELLKEHMFHKLTERKAASTFIGNNYYCESGNGIPSEFDFAGHLYDNDPIWDGKLCEGQCCTRKSPPWFSVM